MRQTGGRAVGATSTRSSPASRAWRRASAVETTPTCSSFSLIRRTGEMRICSLWRKFVEIRGSPIKPGPRWKRQLRRGQASPPCHSSMTAADLPELRRKTLRHLPGPGPGIHPLRGYIMRFLGEFCKSNSGWEIRESARLLIRRLGNCLSVVGNNGKLCFEPPCGDIFDIYRSSEPPATTASH